VKSISPTEEARVMETSGHLNSCWTGSREVSGIAEAVLAKFEINFKARRRPPENATSSPFLPEFVVS
jgi:hypothetical protein